MNLGDFLKEKKTNRTYKIEPKLYLHAKKTIKEETGLGMSAFIYQKIIEFLKESEENKKNAE